MKKLNYARLALMRGVNLQKGQILVISAPLWTADFAHLLMEEAFALGARDVVIRYDDPQAERIRLLHAPEEALCDVPRWMSESQTCYADKGAAYLRISSAKPGMMDGVDAARLGMRQRALNAPLRAFNLRRMANEVAWSVICVPNAEWAQQVYPDRGAQAALDALWEDMYSCCYVTGESPVAGWDAHVEDMQRMVKRLNGLRPVALHLKNGLGTDLHLRMCEEGVFAGGICHCPEPDGVCFAPNIPTEEILTTPHRLSAEGVVVNTLPLVYNGSLIDDFRLTFRGGEVTDWSCGVGAELLRGILETDEGSRRLGEVALVPYDSPIRRTGVLFYNTLFDENASCHLALGAGYVDVLHGKDRSEAALIAQGLNTSMLHVDFMFGSSDMRCTVETAAGEQVDVFRDGVFVL